MFRNWGGKRHTVLEKLLCEPVSWALSPEALFWIFLSPGVAEWPIKPGCGLLVYPGSMPTSVLQEEEGFPLKLRLEPG